MEMGAVPFVPVPSKRDVASFGGTRSVAVPKTECNWNDGTAEPKRRVGVS